MPQDQLSQIRPIVQELKDVCKTQDNWCANFEVSGSAIWVQFTKNALNLYWVGTEEDANRSKNH